MGLVNEAPSNTPSLVFRGSMDAPPIPSAAAEDFGMFGDRRALSPNGPLG